LPIANFYVTISGAMGKKSDVFVSRRQVLKIAGLSAAVITFFPKIAFAARNSLNLVRTGSQPGNKTRLVLETSARPSYSISYLGDPDRMTIELSNCEGTKAKQDLASGTLIKSIETIQNGDRLQVVATLRRQIPPLEKKQISILEPNGDYGYRLFMDFSAGVSGAIVADTKPVEAEKPKPHVIVIDAGHGGKDPGCIGPNGIKEKEIVLSVARKFRNQLKAAGFSVYLTRDSDVFLNLDTRAGIAGERKANLFISIHANANPSKKMQGFSIFTLDKKASDEEAQKLADAENAADKIGFDDFKTYPPDVKNILSTLQQTDITRMSVEFAVEARKSLQREKITEQPGGLRRAPFAVLRSTIPGALVEIGHLSNAEEEKLLNNGKHQDRLVSALVRAVKNYDFE
jgi:N-acetylmuramoyl-L-alanine amidase